MKRFALALLLALPVLVCAYLDWDVSGVPIMQSEYIRWKGVNEVCNDNTEIIVWVDSSNEYYGVYAQRINSEGEVIWENPIQIDEGVANCYLPKVTVLQDGDIVIAWVEKIDGIFTIKLQKIDEDGNHLWNNFMLDLDNDVRENSIQLISNNDNSVFVFWEYRSNDCGIGAVKIESDGTVNSSWLDYDNEIYGFCCYSAVSDGENGFYIVTSTENVRDLYINQISENGEKLWGYWGQLIYTGNEHISKINIIQEEGLLFVSYSINYEGLYTILVDENAQNQWEQPLCVSSNLLRSRFNIAFDNENNLIIQWQSATGLRLQKIDINGQLYFGEEGLLIYDLFASGNYVEFNLVTDENAIFVNWSENSLDIKIGYASIDYNGTINFVNIEEIASNHLHIPSISLKKIGDNFSSICLMSQNFSNQILCQIIDSEGNYLLEECGIEIVDRKVINVSDWYSKNIDGDNYYLCVLYDSEYKIVMQKITEDGELCFDKPGIILLEPSSINSFNSIYNGNEDSFAITWMSNTETEDQIHFMTVNREGQVLTTDMIVSGGNSIYPLKPEIFPINSESNAYLIMWLDYTNFFSPTIKCQKVVEGTAIWQDGGIDLFDEDVLVNEFYGTTKNYLIASVGQWPFWNFTIKKIGTNGLDESWPEEGVTIGVSNTLPELMVSDDFLLVVEERWENYNEAISVHKIDLSGNILTPEEGVILITEDDVELVSAVYNDALYILWEQFDETSNSLIVQKFDDDLNPLWPEGGVVLEYIDDNYQYNINSSCMEVIGDDLLIGWISSTDFSENIIRTQMLSSDGDFLLSSPEVWVCSVEGYKSNLTIDVFENHANFSWLDRRAIGYDEEPYNLAIFTQKLTLPLTDMEESDLPNLTPLLSNYPNPFNPSTNINFNLSESDNITMEIYNIKGQKVKTLINNEYKEQGNYSMQWVGTDDYDKPITSGIYLCRIVGSKHSFTKKMILLK